MNELIKASDISLKYKDGDGFNYAVNAVSVTLPHQGYIGIIGPSGSGKSSLLYLLSGIKMPTQGVVYFSGHALNKDDYSLRRKNMGFVFQFHFLISYMSVKENILVGLDNKSYGDNEYFVQIIDKLELTKLLHRKPHELSGGQRQRVAIARAIIHKPKVLFVDEPTASLDHFSSAKVTHILEELSKESLVITVTHDHRILSNADRIIKMEDGKLIL